MKKLPKILLVDDDKDMCESLSDILSLDSAYTISYCTDSWEALEMVKAENFSLIILDFKMPLMNGLDLLRHIREVKPGARVILLTAFMSNELVEKAEKEGAVKVLSKFVWPDDIIKFIKDILG